MGAFLDALQSTGESAPTSGGMEAPQAAGDGIGSQIEQHLSQLPDEQKAYLAQYLTPELANIMGILLGEEAAQFFSQYVDPSKTLTVVSTGEMGGQPQATAPSQPSIGIAPGAAPAQGTPSGPIMGPVQQ